MACVKEAVLLPSTPLGSADRMSLQSTALGPYSQISTPRTKWNANTACNCIVFPMAGFPLVSRSSRFCALLAWFFRSVSRTCSQESSNHKRRCPGTEWESWSSSSWFWGNQMGKQSASSWCVLELLPLPLVTQLHPPNPPPHVGIMHHLVTTRYYGSMTPTSLVALVKIQFQVGLACMRAFWGREKKVPVG